jgi:hypothetical protein
MDLPVPCDLQGRVLEELFTRERVDRNTLQVGEPTAWRRPDGDQEPLSEDDSRILDKLKALGYIE